MSTPQIVRNTSPSPIAIPPVYGGGFIAPGDAISISDTPANVKAAFTFHGSALPAGTWISITATPAPIASAITPPSTGAGGGQQYTPTTPGNWSPTPSTVGGGLDQLAADVAANTTELATHATEIATNTTNIATNTSAIAAIPKIQTGTASLGAGGTVSVTGVTIDAGSKIFLTANTPGGTVGELSVPAASRANGAGTGHFVINSSSSSDSSTVDWMIVG